MEGDKTVKISESNWRELIKIRIERGLRTFNDVVSYLIKLKKNQNGKST